MAVQLVRQVFQNRITVSNADWGVLLAISLVVLAAPVVRNTILAERAGTREHQVLGNANLASEIEPIAVPTENPEAAAIAHFVALLGQEAPDAELLAVDSASALTPEERMAEVFSALGCPGSVYSASPRELYDLAWPFLARLKVDDSPDLWLIVRRIDDGYVYGTAPGTGNVLYREADFGAAWTGRVLVFDEPPRLEEFWR